MCSTVQLAAPAIAGCRHQGFFVFCFCLFVVVVVVVFFLGGGVIVHDQLYLTMSLSEM
jgi:hypothetical protein